MYFCEEYSYFSLFSRKLNQICKKKKITKKYKKIGEIKFIIC